MDFPDLTVDGTFPLGAAVMASALIAGINPVIALLLAFVAGLAAGCVTAAIHNYLKVPGLLAGILTMTMLWSINIRAMGGKANMPLLGVEGIIKQFERFAVPFLGADRQVAVELSHLILIGAVALAILFGLILFFRTDMGISIGAMGNNQQMVISGGQDPRQLKFVGLGLSNGLVALAGAFAAQYNGFADVNLGQGIIIAGLASVMLGEFVLRSNKISLLAFRVLLGSLLYRAIMYGVRRYGMEDINVFGLFSFKPGLTPSDLKLLTGIIIIIAIAASIMKKTNEKKNIQQRKGAGNAQA